MKVSNLCLTVILALFVSGCATDIAQKSRKAGVTSIRVHPKVDTDEPMRIGFRESTGNLSVALGNLIVNEMYQKRLATLSSNMQHNAIDVHEMVRQQTAAMLQQKKDLTVVTNGGDAVLLVAISQYGFDSAGLSLSRDVPYIVLRGELTRQGERVWRGQGQAHPLRSGDLGAKLEEYYANPELLRKHWEAQVNRALEDLLQAN